MCPLCELIKMMFYCNVSIPSCWLSCCRLHSAKWMLSFDKFRIWKVLSYGGSNVCCFMSALILAYCCYLRFWNNVTFAPLIAFSSALLLPVFSESYKILYQLEKILETLKDWLYFAQKKCLVIYAYIAVRRGEVWIAEAHHYSPTAKHQFKNTKKKISFSFCNDYIFSSPLDPNLKYILYFKIQVISFQTLGTGCLKQMYKHWNREFK